MTAFKCEIPQRWRLFQPSIDFLTIGPFSHSSGCLGSRGLHLFPHTRLMIGDFGFHSSPARMRRKGRSAPESRVGFQDASPTSGGG